MELTLENYQNLKKEKLTRAKIASVFNIPEWKLKKYISANGWASEAPTVVNTTAFNEYTEESCYWAGFLMADGNVDSKGRVRLMLKYDDILHLEKFKTYLKSTHTISSNTDKYNRCSFEFTNREMCEVLEFNFNIVPCKSLISKFPKIPNKFLRDFIRGYFDGDGSVCESFSNKNSVTSSIYATFACGSKEFIEHLYLKINSTLGTVGHLQDFGSGKKWQIKYNTNDAKLLLDYMYKDCAVYLDRKYALYQRLVVDNNRTTRDKGIVHTTSNSG